MRTIIPKSNITEDKDYFFIVCEIPGVKKENLNIEIEDDVLFIEGDMKNDHFKEDEMIYQEFHTDFSYKRKFILENKINPNKILAKLESGILYLSLEKTEESKARKIQIQ